MYSDNFKAENSLAKYFSSWYDRVIMLDIKGRNGRPLTVPLTLFRMGFFGAAHGSGGGGGGKKAPPP